VILFNIFLTINKYSSMSPLGDFFGNNFMAV
jgi:hypothetical protein